MPEEEAADYFDRRLHLYHVISQDDWRSRVFEIDELLTYFYSKEDWKSDHQIIDQDVENLAAIYQIKQGIERLVHDNLHLDLLRNSSQIVMKTGAEHRLFEL